MSRCSSLSRPVSLRKLLEWMDGDCGVQRTGCGSTVGCIAVEPRLNFTRLECLHLLAD